MAKFKLGSVLVCEDARKEVSGKDILIGVYTSAINVGQLPGMVNLCAWIEVIPLQKGQLFLEVKIEVPGNPQPFALGVMLDVQDEADSIAFATPLVSFPLLQEGTIQVFVREQGAQKWPVVKRVKVRHRPQHFATRPGAEIPGADVAADNRGGAPATP